MLEINDFPISLYCGWHVSAKHIRYVSIYYSTDNMKVTSNEFIDNNAVFDII